MPFVLYLLALVVFAMGTSEFMLSGLVQDIAAGFDVPVGTAGVLTSAFAVGMVVGAPLMAAVTRRLRVRGILLAFILLFAAAHVVGATTSDFTVLVVTRMVAAFVNAGFLAVALAASSRLVGPTKKGRAVAVLLAGTTVATVAGVPAGAALGAAWGWQSTFWAIAVLCVPAAVGVAIGFNPRVASLTDEERPPELTSEIAQLVAPRLVMAMMLAALVNAGTFAALTFLSPVATDVAGLERWWVPIVLVLFGIGSFAGVTIAGRLSDRRPRPVLIIGGVSLTVGWVALAVCSSSPTAFLCLVFVQGVLSFGVGSTLITRVLYAASAAPTMGGSYATAALNVGAVAGPLVGAMALATPLGLTGPIWVAAIASGLALLVAIPTMGLIAPRGIRSDGLAEARIRRRIVSAAEFGAHDDG